MRVWRKCRAIARLFNVRGDGDGGADEACFFGGMWTVWVYFLEQQKKKYILIWWDDDDDVDDCSVVLMKGIHTSAFIL